MIISGKNGELTIPGKNIKVKGSLELATKELSGQSSSTASVKAGNKPKKLSVSGTVPDTDMAGFKKLLSFAEALTDNGDRLTYIISDDVAEWLGIKKVRFEGNISLDEADGLNAYNYSFSLKEVDSSNEKKENTTRINKTEGQPSGTNVASGSITDQARKAASILVEKVVNEFNMAVSDVADYLTNSFNMALSDAIALAEKAKAEGSNSILDSAKELLSKSTVQDELNTVFETATSGIEKTQSLVSSAASSALNKVQGMGLAVDSNIIAHTVNSAASLANKKGLKTMSYSQIINTINNLTDELV